MTGTGEDTITEEGTHTVEGFPADEAITAGAIMTADGTGAIVTATTAVITADVGSPSDSTARLIMGPMGMDTRPVTTTVQALAADTTINGVTGALTPATSIRGPIS